MAYVGPWGTFIRIPRTSSTSYGKWLTAHHKQRGVEHGHYHWIPLHDTPKPWVVTLREPALMLRSMWAYLSRTTEQVQHYNQFLGPVAGMLFTRLSPLAWDKPFEEFANAYLAEMPGAITWLVKAYTMPGVEVITKHNGPMVNTSRDHFKPWPELGPSLERKIVLVEEELYRQYFPKRWFAWVEEIPY